MIFLRFLGFFCFLSKKKLHGWIGFPKRRDFFQTDRLTLSNISNKCWESLIIINICMQMLTCLPQQGAFLVGMYSLYQYRSLYPLLHPCQLAAVIKKLIMEEI
jgi:hypothetical protein